ncbi:CCDC90 family protein [Methylobacterium sp. J-030]|uniref:CCDC90 family protein n=1 Tax=Methylobacterium sp. J-030 TaxID=2836627 RepID=UPI001FBBE718|nr:CCDC90 family protein [Methylobacterium sp. J-030]MCJ2073792.1 CCDC90 family protein [Methylobacterium sp. J-030]
MAAVAFDTLKFARTLRDKAKLSPEQAEGLTDAMAEALQGDLVTKADLRAALADTRSEIVRWVAGLIGFLTLAVIGAVIALARALH